MELENNHWAYVRDPYNEKKKRMKEGQKPLTCTNGLTASYHRGVDKLVLRGWERWKPRARERESRYPFVRTGEFTTRFIDY